MAQIAAIGEVMVELAPHHFDETIGRELLSLGFAGDTFNTSVYLARGGVQTHYVTLLGDDPYSLKIIQLAKQEKVKTELTQTMPGRLPGMYLIRNTETGEREFYYWRKEARARELFTEPSSTEALIDQLMNKEYIYFSGITLAIISEKSRYAMMEFIAEYRRQGGKVCFDINYRPRLWEDKNTAQQVIKRVMPLVDIAMITLDDETMLWGDGSIASTVNRYKGDGIDELLLKRGADEVICINNERTYTVPVAKVDGVIDTTGAGDAFNGAYLAARLHNLPIEKAVEHAIHVASIVIRNRGAIVAEEIFNRFYRGIETFR